MTTDQKFNISSKLIPQEIVDIVLKLFNKSLITDDALLDYDYVNKSTIKFGVLVDKRCCTLPTLNYLIANASNYNTTFYKSWNDVISKDRFELLLDQLLHYSSTYGTNFNGNPYIPNDNPENVEFKKFLVILPISIDEVASKIRSMLESGIALNGNTINDLILLITHLNIDINIDTIKNKEIKLVLYDLLGKFPNSPTEMVRYLVYIITKSTLLIKNKTVINEIKEIIENEPALSFRIGVLIKRYGIEKLSSVFYRFKPLFLAMKSEQNNNIINRLRKLAKKHHKPYKHSFFEKLLTDENVDLNELKNKIDSLNNYKKIQLLQTISIREKQLGIRSFVIRNGKLFVKEDDSIPYNDQYPEIYKIIYSSLINSLKNKGKLKIRLPKNVELALPTSGKSFIGNYPLGSKINIQNKDAIVGINWRKEDGASDLDLSLITLSGDKIGWNSSYYDDSNKIVYSGDMVTADPEATELLYAKRGFKTGIIKINLYNGKSNSKFKMFFGSEPIAHIDTNYMIDPNNITFEDWFKFTDNQEFAIGMIDHTHFTFLMLQTGYSKVSKNDTYTYKWLYYMNQIKDTYLDLKSVLYDANFEIVDNDLDSVDIDLNNLNKSTLIELFKN